MVKRLSIAIFILAAAPVWGVVTPNGMVVLLTDYGADSVYVGAIKGAIYTKFPAAKIDSITNSVPEYDIGTGAYMLVETCREFPVGTVFCCVVDPGVGTERKCVVLETGSGHLFVAPDNGLLSLAAQKYTAVETRECTNQALWREGKLSHTFQGRDIFGPVSAALASGIPLDQVGEKIDAIKEIDFGKPEVEGDTISGVVTRVDSYGNIITNITFEDLQKMGFQQSDTVEVTIGKAAFKAPLERTYSDVPKGERLGLVQSLGYLEFAINMGSLAEAIEEGNNAPVSVRKVK
jgi:hypothetical protein